MKRIILLCFLSLTLLLGDTFNVSNMREFREALENSALNGSNDTIVLESGVYDVTSDGEGTLIFADTEEYNLTISAANGLTSDEVKLSGNKKSTILNVIISGTGVFTLRNVTLEYGYEYFSGIGYKKGGSVYAESSLYLNNVGIFGGTDSIYVKGSQKDYKYQNFVKILNSNISYNVSTNFMGGNIFISQMKSVEILNSVISNSKAWDDASILSISADTILMDKSTIDNNNGEVDDTVTIIKLNAINDVIISDTVISNNTLDSGYILNSGSLTMNNSILSDNNAGRYGLVMRLGDGIIYNNKFLRNIAKAMTFNISEKGILVNNLFQNNVTSDLNLPLFSIGKGGVTDHSFVRGFCINNTFQSNIDNVSYHNAVLDIFGPVINTIFDDQITTEAIFFIGDSFVYNTYVDYAKLINPYNYTIIKKHNQKPSYGDIALDDEGKPLSGSLAINNGLDPYSNEFKDLIGNTEVYGTILEILKTDLDGNKRIVGSEIDIGAYEEPENQIVPVITYLLN